MRRELVKCEFDPDTREAIFVTDPRHSEHEAWKARAEDRVSGNGHNSLGHVYVVMPEESCQIDNEPYVFNTEVAAHKFAELHGGWVSAEPILDDSFNEEPA